MTDADPTPAPESPESELRRLREDNEELRRHRRELECQLQVLRVRLSRQSLQSQEVTLANETQIKSLLETVTGLRGMVVALRRGELEDQEAILKGLGVKE